ncbi:MAG TPA: ribonuclease H [Polyangiaceae bacterium]
MERPIELAHAGYVRRLSECASRGQEFSIDLARATWRTPAFGMTGDRVRLSPQSPAHVAGPKPGAAGRRGPGPSDANTVIAYTDGACSGNPGPGGWAWAVQGGSFATGAEEHTTNQRMEMTAAYQAVLAHPGPIQVVSDSTYVVNCFKQRWWEGWLKRGWTNSQRKPVANRDLWEPFIDLVRTRGNVDFRWVKGHSEDRMNQFVDQLAVEASLTQLPRSGRCP